MSAKTPIRTVFDGSNNATGLAEFQSGEFVALTHGGLGASLSIGSAGQVLKVNSSASALEFGNVEAVLNIDGMTDGTSITIADGDLLAISDGGTEKRVTASQLKTYIGGYDGTIGTLDIDGGTDIGAALADADLFIVDDGAGGTNRKMAASRIKTYVADITLTTAAQTNITSLGTLTSLSVDDITIDGSTISDSGDFTLDVGGTITLDSASEFLFNFGNAGNIAKFSKNSTGVAGGLQLTTISQDADFVIKGNDGGSFITALTLDMSAAGAATFNDKIVLGANKAIEFGDAGESISGDGTDMTITGNIVKIDAASRIILDAAENRIDLLDNGTEFARFVNNGGQLQIRTGSSSAVGVSFDSSGGATFGQNLAVTGDLTVNGTTTTVNSTTVTIDDPIFTLGGDSAPSSDDNKDRGIEFRYHTGSAAKVGFFGYDDSASAFTFIADASNSSEVFSGSAGDVVFGNISIGDSNKVNIGAGNDLQLYHDGSDSFIDDAGTGDLKIRSSFTRIIDKSNSHVAATFASGGVNLRHSNSVKFTTTSAGATVTGALTADGGLKADNITIDGTEIDLSSGDLTIDVAGDIILDADGSEVKFLDGGTQFGHILKSGNNFEVKSTISDGDLTFHGNDGGSAIEALKLDMSEAGDATFNSNIFLGDNKKANFGAGNDLQIYHDGSQSIIEDAGTGQLKILAENTLFFGSTTGSEKYISAVKNGRVDLSYDNVVKLETTSTGATVTGALDVTGAPSIGNDEASFGFNAPNAELKAKNSSGSPAANFDIHTTNTSGTTARVFRATHDGILQLMSGDTVVGKLSNSSSDFVIESDVQDKDIIFKGDDGGSGITALTLDMSEAGAATFNSHVTLGNSKELRMGASGDDIVFDGTNLLITATNGLILDGDQQIMFNDGGVNYGAFVSSSTRFTIHSQTSNKDFAINVNDGGSQLDALIFDASEAGAATFNSTIKADGGKDVILGKNQGTNFTNSLLIGHATTGTLDSAQNNLGVGISALDAITSGDSNVALGTSAGSALTTGALNVFIGTSAGAGATDPQGNIAIGAAALGSADPGNNNIAIGESAGKLITGVRNLVIGENAGDNITSGSGNVIIGSAVDADSATGNRQLKIAGNSGGATTTWISGDDAGALTFADKVVLAANKSIEFGDSGETISGDGTNLSIVSSNSLGIDTANGITLDSGSGGATLKAGGGTTYGTLTSNSGSLSINQTTSDKDIIFTGNDGGSTIEAMRIDMSEGGKVGIGTNAPSRDLHVKKSTSGSPVRFEVNNTSDTGGSHGVISIYSGGTSGGDPYLHFKVNNGEQYSIGIDNSSSDAFVLSNNFGVGSTNLLSIATDGSASFTEKIIMGTNKEVQFVDTNESIKSDGSKLIIKSGGTTFNFPTADGDADQVLTTDGSGTLSFAAAGGAGSGFSESTITTLPGQEGNFDLAKTNNAGSAETGLTAGGTDSFGVALGSVYTMMEPVGASTTNNTDLGSSESHVGA